MTERRLFLVSQIVRRRAMVVVVSILACITPAQAGQYRVTAVYDGDTIEAQANDTVIRVRLMGIDAPEICRTEGARQQPFAQAASERLTGLIYGKFVDIESYGLDPHNQLLGVVYLDDKNINLEMVAAGLAEVHRGKVRKDFDLAPYLQAEQVARMTQQGIWSVGTIHISPRVWRK
jgi:endonuclease YncB( thermonuclease family)